MLVKRCSSLWIIFFVVFFIMGCTTEADDWSEASKIHTVESYTNYLKDHKLGAHALEAQESIAWLEATQMNTSALYKSYLVEHNNGKHVKEAQESLDWLEAVQTNTSASYKSYIEKHNNGIHAKEARERNISAMLSTILEAVLNEIPNGCSYEYGVGIIPGSQYHMASDFKFAKEKHIELGNGQSAILETILQKGSSSEVDPDQRECAYGEVKALVKRIGENDKVDDEPMMIALIHVDKDSSRILYSYGHASAKATVDGVLYKFNNNNQSWSEDESGEGMSFPPTDLDFLNL